MCREICDGSGAGICDGAPLTCSSVVLEEKIFKGFYHIWAWQPFWSMDHDHFSNLSFSCPKEALHEI